MKLQQVRLVSSLNKLSISLKRQKFTQRGHTKHNFDCYGFHIAPLNILENQVIPAGKHDLTKSFRPTLATIRILSLVGTKFISRCDKFYERQMFKYFNNFKRKMNRKLYFSETKPEIFEKNNNFKLKGYFYSPNRIFCGK